MSPKYISFPKTTPFGPKHLGVMFTNSDDYNFNKKIKATNFIEEIKNKYVLGLDNKISLPKEFFIQEFDDVCYVSKNIYFKNNNNNKFTQLSPPPNRYVNAIRHRIELYQRQGLLGFKNKLFGNLFYKYPKIFNDVDFVQPKLIRVTKEYVECEKWISDGK